jgi:hypothetical protein
MSLRNCFSLACLSIYFCITEEDMPPVTSFCVNIKLNIQKTIYYFPCNSLIKDQERTALLTAKIRKVV